MAVNSHCCVLCAGTCSHTLEKIFLTCSPPQYPFSSWQEGMLSCSTSWMEQLLPAEPEEGDQGCSKPDASSFQRSLFLAGKPDCNVCTSGQVSSTHLAPAVLVSETDKVLGSCLAQVIPHGEEFSSFWLNPEMFLISLCSIRHPGI